MRKRGGKGWFGHVTTLEGWREGSVSEVKVGEGRGRGGGGGGWMRKRGGKGWFGHVATLEGWRGGSVSEVGRVGLDTLKDAEWEVLGEVKVGEGREGRRRG